jgi:hypothetical protein
MAVTKLRTKTPEGSLRYALKAALKEAKAAHTVVARQKQAVSRLFAQIIEAEEAIAPLEAAVKKAEADHVRSVAEAAVLEKPAPASGVAEALASLAFANDRIHTLRAARQTIEAEIPDYQAEAVAADTEVERLISVVISDYIQVCVLEATELARRLKPYRAALMSFVRDHGARPTQYHLQPGFDKARAPLDEAADDVWQFFRELREAETPPINPWKSVRERLRENPDGAVLRELVQQFDGLFDKSADDQHRSEPT